MLSLLSGKRSGACVAVLLGLFASCAHLPRSTEELKPAVERFFRQLRWRDFHGLAPLIVPERREAFERALVTDRDGKDLEISEYEIEEVHVSNDGRHAVVLSQLSWHRLPSMSEHQDPVSTEWVYRDGNWLLARMNPGPFVDALGDPYREEHGVEPGGVRQSAHE